MKTNWFFSARMATATFMPICSEFYKAFISSALIWERMGCFASLNTSQIKRICAVVIAIPSKFPRRDS